MGIKMKLRGLFASALLALSMAAPSQGFAITNALYLTMDGSASLDAAEFILQRDGYVSALNSVLGGGAFYGNTAIGVSVFGGDVQEIFGLTLINNAADLAALTAAIAALDPTQQTTNVVNPAWRAGVDQGSTAIGDAINNAATAIQNSFATATNKVIDVSTDGLSNTGANASAAAIAALGNDITTNCLGVGAGASCNFETGFEVLVADFAGFEAALIEKLEKELGVPEPGILALLSMGLIAIGFVRRKA